MGGNSLRVRRLALAASILFMPAVAVCAGQAAGTGSNAAQALPQDPTSVNRTQNAAIQSFHQTRAQRRAARKLARQKNAAAAQQLAAGSPVAQQERDQKILDQEKAQSAETARENDAVTQEVIRDRQKVQAEPRIQDAPGPGSQPLPGDPAVEPAQPASPPRIQDAPGPAQTLAKAPPSSPAPENATPPPQL